MADTNWAQSGDPGLFGSNTGSGGGFNLQNFGKYSGDLGGGIGSLIAMLMGRSSGNMPNPANGAMGYLNQIGGTLGPYYNPYIGQGQQAMGTAGSNYAEMLKNLPGLQSHYNDMMSLGLPLQQQYAQMAQDPAGNMNKIGATYQQSPGYAWQVGQGMNAANNAAAAGGMLGSPQHQQQASTMVQGLANQDYYNYLGNALGQQQQGLAGESGLYGAGLAGAQGLFSGGLGGLEGLMKQGYGASTGLGENLSSALLSQALLSYAGQANQNYGQQQQAGQQAGLMGGGIADLIKFLPFLLGG